MSPYRDGDYGPDDYGSQITEEDAREYHQMGLFLIASMIGLALVMCAALAGAA